MNLGEVLQLGPVCEVCGETVRQLYPVTHYDGKHFRPVKACITCCGPARDDDRTSWRLNVDLPKRKS